MAVKLDEDYRIFLNEGILRNVAISDGVKATVKNLLSVIDNHECVCTCGKKKKK